MTARRRPAPKLAGYWYAAIDSRDKKPVPEILFMEKTRRAARDKVEWSKDADHLRVVRARVLLYNG